MRTTWRVVWSRKVGEPGNGPEAAVGAWGDAPQLVAHDRSAAWAPAANARPIKAKPADAKRLMTVSLAGALFVTERVDGVERGGALGGEIAEDHADQGRDAESDQIDLRLPQEGHLQRDDQERGGHEGQGQARSEERRVGKEGRSRGSPEQ